MAKIENKNKADLILLLVAIIWGAGFIATEYAIDAGMGTSLIMTMRFGIAAIAMLLFCIKDLKNIDKKSLKCGVIAGFFLFGGFYLQTYGQGMTTVSNSAFLTSTNVVMIPFIVWLVSKKRPKTKIFLLTLTTLVGIGFLTLDFSSGISFAVGDIFILLCAFMFALHISYLGTAATGINVKILTFIQLATSGVLSLASLLLFDIDSVSVQVLIDGGIPATYLALFSTCLCYFLQTYGQQRTTASKAGIILCTEGLFGSLFSVLLGFEALTLGMVIGGIVIIGSIILMESKLDFKQKS